MERTGQSEFVFEPLGTEAGLATELDDLTFQAGRGLIGAVMATTAVFPEGRGFAGHRTPAPFADCVARAAELAGGGLEAVSAGEGDEHSKL